VTCPTCGKVAERRMSAGAGLLFKGSGFYLTDYGKNAHRGTPGGESTSAGEAKAEKSSSESKAESKSEPKSESKPAESKSSDAKPASAPAPKNTKASE
jgi:predicted nucleic acid-binding Zn ribbon protein